MSTVKSLLGIIVVALLVIAFSSFYTVHEGQNGLLLRLGKLERDSKTGKVEVMTPGLHWKIPFIEQPRLFDTRIQTLDIQSSRIVTAEKKYVIVDYYVKWRISDLPAFFVRTTGDYIQAGNLLQQQLNDTLRAQFGQRTINEVVSEDRTNIMAKLLEQANITAKTMGIDVIDVRIKKIDLPETVTNTVYQQMRAERERVATEHRSLGRAKAEAIHATADANVTITIATATKQGAKLRALGTAISARIYAEAYTKDAAFYAFYRSIEAYQQSFTNKKDILVLKPDSQFFKYFNTAGNKK